MKPVTIPLRREGCYRNQNNDPVLNTAVYIQMEEEYIAKIALVEPVLREKLSVQDPHMICLIEYGP